MSKIDKILEQQVYPYYELQYHDQAKEHIKYIKQALYKDMVELIGEGVELRDEKDHLPNTYYYLKSKNDLRQELRTKLKEYYGIDV